MKKFLQILFAIICFVSCFLMMSVDASKEHWLMLELTFCAAFIISFIVLLGIDNEDWVKKHFYAFRICLCAFLYRELNIKTDKTRKCNNLRRKKMYYKDTYKYCVRAYEKHFIQED